MTEAYVFDALRTPRGKGKKDGTLHEVKPIDLLTGLLTELQCKLIDECLQLFGGYGYMWEYPIARAWADARVQRIYGGTNEIMKEVITRGMGLPAR